MKRPDAAHEASNEGESPPGSLGEMVARSRAMRGLEETLRRIARGAINVLILGETGVGKGVVAEYIHRASPRARAPFLRLNCAAFSETLLESELCGHERGAFTGADRAKPGLLEIADGGTVLLDEIAEVPERLQVMLLRILEDGAVRRVGGTAGRRVNVRFLAATNRDVARRDHAALRRDLFYRLSGARVTVPPLRARADEVAPLVRGFLASARHSLGLAAAPELSPEALALLQQYRWPGNVRELRNVVDRAVLMCTGGVILPGDLPPEIGGLDLPEEEEDEEEEEEAPPAEGWDRWENIHGALTRCGGNQTRAAELLGVSRRTLTRRLTRLGFPRPLKGQPGRRRWPLVIGRV